MNLLYLRAAITVYLMLHKRESPRCVYINMRSRGLRDWNLKRQLPRPEWPIILMAVLGFTQDVLLLWLRGLRFPFYGSFGSTTPRNSGAGEVVVTVVWFGEVGWGCVWVLVTKTKQNKHRGNRTLRRSAQDESGLRLTLWCTPKSRDGGVSLGVFVLLVWVLVVQRQRDGGIDLSVGELWSLGSGLWMEEVNEGG